MAPLRGLTQKEKATKWCLAHPGRCAATCKLFKKPSLDFTVQNATECCAKKKLNLGSPFGLKNLKAKY
jgi:hypothetical protein